MKRVYFFLLLLAGPLSVFAQTSAADPIDVLGWYGTGITFDLKKKWEAGIDYQARFQNNLASFKGSYISFSGSKMISKRVGLQGEYRLGLVQGSSFHRFSFGAEYAPKVSGLDLTFRLLVLNNIQDFLDPVQASQNDLYWRARARLGMRLSKKWAAYLSSEPVMKFGGNRFVDNLRNTIGIKRRLSKFAKLDLYYMYRPDYAKSRYNRLFHVIGLNVDFRLPAGKKK
jgi:hypothetical protein